MRIDIPSFNDVKTGLEPVPAGIYLSICESGEVKTAEGGGKYVAWTFSILEGDVAGRKLFFNTSLKEQALWNLKGLLEALNCPMDEGGFATEDAVGLKCMLVVDIEEYQNRQQNRVTNYLPEE